MMLKFRDSFSVVVFIMVSLVCFLSSCSEKKQEHNGNSIVVTISVKDEVFVNGQKVAVDSLTQKLQQLSADKNANIRVVPDPEAGPGTIEKVQRAIRLYKYSAD